MGNTCSDAAFQKQFSSLVQRTNVSHITEIGNLFSKIGGSKDTTLNSEQTKHFFSGLIELIAPQYTESKRDTLLQGWSSKSELSFTEVQQQIDQQFIKEFSLRTFPLKTHCISGVKTTMPVLVQIESPCTLETKKKPPIAIACVLDRSGSMSGDRLKFAIRSVCKVIKHMEPQDVFHLVTFDGNVKIEIENGDLTDKAALKRQVRAIHAGGSTNIGDALTKAASLLAETSLPGNGLKRLYLFGDGMANAGKIITPEGLSDLSARLNKQYDISLTTFGIGKDYNEAIMSGIAKNGAGEYYFIASSQDIPVTMSKAIHGLLNLYGTNCTLRLRGQGDGIVSKLYGKFAKHDLSQPLLLGDLYANDRKKLIFQLELSCKSSSDIEQVVCECTLTFDRIENTTTPQPITQTVTENVTLTFTRNEDLVNSTQENKTVYIAEIMQKVAGIDREIIVQLDKRDYDGAIALKQSSLDMLLAAQSYDAEGTLPKVIARVEEVLQTLKQKKDHNAMRKMVDYEACREEDDDCYGYMCRSDSDEGCYSDDDIRDYVDEISFSDDDYSDDSDCF